ncbi:hypothetical protein EMIT0P44_90179 [Pseudomonas sp. IT-P44]
MPLPLRAVRKLHFRRVAGAREHDVLTWNTCLKLIDKAPLYDAKGSVPGLPGGHQDTGPRA